MAIKEKQNFQPKEGDITASNNHESFEDLSQEETAEGGTEFIQAPASAKEDALEDMLTAVLSQDVDLSVLTADQRKTFGDLIRKMSFRGPSISMAGRTELRQMFSEDQRVHSRSGVSKVETESKKLRTDMQELAASASSGRRILPGQIIGMRAIDSNSSSDTKQYMAIVSFGNQTCRVLIPDFVLFNFNYDKRLDADTQKKVYQRMKSMIGAEIDFVVKHWDAKTKTAYGDRLKAMERLGWNYFLNEKNPDRIVRGMIVEARITAVATRYLIVTAMGVEARIPIEECGWERFGDLREIFTNNQTVSAKVLNITEAEVTKAAREIYRLVGLELSIKRTTKDPRERYWNEYVIGGLCMARVTSIDPNGRGVFVMLENKTPALCAYPSYGAIPKVNDEIIVSITDKVITDMPDGTKDYRIFGVIKRN